MRKTTKTTMTAIAIAAFLSLGALAAPASAQQLSGADLTRMFGPGIRLSGTTSEGYMFVNTYSPNGVLHTESVRSSDDGSWRISGDWLCQTLRFMLGGEERCFALSTAGPGKFQYIVVQPRNGHWGNLQVY